MATKPATEAWPVLVVLPDEIDITNARDVRDQLTAAVAQPGVRIVIADMTATTFCDSMGARALVQAHKRAAANGAELRLLRPCPAVLRIAELLGLDQVLAIYDSLADAIMPLPAGRA
jgi:anti-anti-sigma factor